MKKLSSLSFVVWLTAFQTISAKNELVPEQLIQPIEMEVTTASTTQKVVPDAIRPPNFPKKDGMRVQGSMHRESKTDSRKGKSKPSTNSTNTSRKILKRFVAGVKKDAFESRRLAEKALDNVALIESKLEEENTLNPLNQENQISEN